MRFSARTKTVVLAATVMLVAMGLSLVLVISGLTRRLVRESEEQWRDHLQTTGAVIVSYVAAFQTAEVDQEFLQEYVRGLGEQTSLTIRLLDAKGRCLADSQGPPVGDGAFAELREVRLALKGERGQRYEGAADFGSRLLHVALPVTNEEKTVTGVVLLTRRLDSSVDLARQLREEVWRVAKWTSSVALLVVLIGCWWLFRPLGRLTRAAARLAESGTPEELPVTGNDEVAVLATSFNKLTARLTAASRRRAEWMRGLCDQLRKPVAGLQDSIRNVVEAAPAGDNAFRSRLSRLVLQSERMVRLMDDATLLERLNAGATQPAREALTVREVCTAAVEQVRPWAEHRQVELRLDAPPTKATFRADRGQLKLALCHLLENAVRFSNSGGVVILEAGTNRQQTQFKVLDYGQGMNDETRRRATEAFFTATPPEADFPGGAGLGLTLALRIAEVHGGTLDVLSQERSGTAVTLTLPSD